MGKVELKKKKKEKRKRKKEKEKKKRKNNKKHTSTSKKSQIGSPARTLFSLSIIGYVEIVFEKANGQFACCGSECGVSVRKCWPVSVATE
jgi:hypothetical protein